MSGGRLDPRLLGVGLFLLGLVVGLALGDESAPPPVTVAAPAQTAPPTPPTPAPGPAPSPTQPAPPASPSQPFRQPRANEGVFDVEGTVSDVKLPSTRGPAGSTPYTRFVINAVTGPPLRAGAAGDLRQNPNVRQSLVDPACAGRVVGRFTVAPAPYTGQFDYTVLRLGVVRDNCRP